ncbi:MAG: hypothetical protein H7062_07555 [Candidatus Saccharimonas sp.]|nr:hypothetical protein [Planctomycetaceae bacterium]
MSHRADTTRALILAIAVLCTLPGCVGFRGFGWRHGIDPLAGAPRPRWADDPQVEEVVDHLNRNVDKLQAWRANSVRIRANNMPLSGTLAVERGRHLRLVVNSIAGNEVDMGSNDDLFWIWAKRMPPPEYVYCRHEHTEAVRQAMGIPFEPEWLMQALGVSPLQSVGTKLEIEPTLRQARLVQQVTSAHGQPLRKVILVDLPRGLILEHSVYDYNGKPIAVARLDEHQLDKASGVVLPRRVKLDWPQSDMSLVMNLGQVEINPKGIPSQIWDMPAMKGYQVVDLGTMVQAGTRVAERDAQSPVEFLPPEFGDEENAGRVKLTNVEPTDQEPFADEPPIQPTTTPRKRPIPRDWWDE